MTYASGIKNKIGQYRYADGALAHRTVDGTDFVIGIAGAYDAFGLIGSERNGLFVLNDTRKSVVLDNAVPQSSGYSGPSDAQWAAFNDLVASDDAAFTQYINTHPRSRLVGAN